ncbi:hypothetical protein [Methylomonas sp. AM2-LC]|uniref:hypothetical protein n=1 Tax=Methylomonas sp. AM2-LC TaxID=3153301 RepID=UPI003266C38C
MRYFYFLPLLFSFSHCVSAYTQSDAYNDCTSYVAYIKTVNLITLSCSLQPPYYIASYNGNSWSAFYYPTPCANGVNTNVSPAVCSLPPQTCPQGQYNSGSGCVSIAQDCNPKPGTNAYFDVNTGTCVSSGSESQGCFDGNPSSTTYYPNYCAPTGDCIPAGAICSNNPADVNAAKQASIAAVPPAAAAANKALADAAAADSQANAAANAQAAAAKAASDQAAAAQAAAAAAQSPNPQSTSALNADKTAANDSANAAAANAAAANAADAAADADKQAKKASDSASSITSGTGANNANGYAKSASDAAAAAAADAQAALNGQPHPGGTAATGTGTSVTGSNDGQCLDCPDLESMMKGTGDKPSSGTSKGFSDQTVTDSITAAQNAYTDKLASVQKDLGKLVSIPAANANASMPKINYGDFKIAGQTITVAADYSQYNDQFSWVGAAVMFMAAFFAIRLFLD